MTDNKTYWALKKREWELRNAALAGEKPRSSSARRLLKNATVRKAVPEDLPYRELQAKAKELEIPANQSKEDLAAAIEEASVEGVAEE